MFVLREAFEVPFAEIAVALALDVADDRVQALRSVVNPDKLGHLGPVADIRAMLRSVSQG